MTQREIKFFYPITNKNCLSGLKDWLKERRYNSWTYTGRDKNDNQIIPLRWDSKPDSDWGKPGPVLGIVVVKQPKLEDEILSIVRKEAGKSS